MFGREVCRDVAFCSPLRETKDDSSFEGVCDFKLPFEGFELEEVACTGCDSESVVVLVESLDLLADSVVVELVEDVRCDAVDVEVTGNWFCCAVVVELGDLIDVEEAGGSKSLIDFRFEELGGSSLTTGSFPPVDRLLVVGSNDLVADDASSTSKSSSVEAAKSSKSSRAVSKESTTACIRSTKPGKLPSPSNSSSSSSPAIRESSTFVRHCSTVFSSDLEEDDEDDDDDIPFLYR